jgi:two-component system chemotaxis response regulator CheB
MSIARRTLRILAADDSAVMRGVLRTVFQLHAQEPFGHLPPMELCGVVNNGLEALEAVRTLAPDVLLLDFEMPKLGGLGVLEKLRSLAPELPVIMCSAYTERGARSTLDALAAGAKDYVMKPGQQKDFASALDSLMQDLLPRIAALAGGAGGSERALRGGGTGGAPTGLARGEGVVVIGVSTGGPSALEAMLPALPGDFPAPILIVQHMPKLFTGALAERLNRLCRLTVREAADGEAIRAGGIWLAPGDSHMEIAPGNTIRLHHGPMLNSCKPSVDYLFRSAAQVQGSATLAVILTGMGSDGLGGAEAVHAAGGTVLAQDEATSAVWGMPGRVTRAGLAHAVLPLGAIAPELVHRLSSNRMPRPRESARAGSHPANEG